MVLTGQRSSCATCSGLDDVAASAMMMRRGEEEEEEEGQVIPVGVQTLAAVPWCIGGMARVVMLLSLLVEASSRHQSAPHELRRGGTSRDSASKLKADFNIHFHSAQTFLILVEDYTKIGHLFDDTHLLIYSS